MDGTRLIDYDEIAIEILEKVISKNFNFPMTYTAIEEDGTVTHTYTERSEEVIKGIVRILKQNL
jgi:hypothetical protein